ncbi:c-type cytochrome [Salipiger mucosus]|uniref:Cytochrome c domain-containing protein n=1 Tax=Salipiger mucosus DSM 16094 TaxID=1123237 RepID=S9S4P9_9RHOB|nr:c-type cytochrome [Salipiger mucosus]EPX85155.1 hypothetical protein Salmuc_01111 [Salipiger mucosus DSM 16094]
MHRLFASIATAGAVTTLAVGAAQAADMTLGEFEYQNSCVACHGEGGKGDGPIAGFMSEQTVADLTVLQKNNGGVFPVQRVYETIDGTMGMAAHGARDMPVWGQRYRARAAATQDYAFGPEETEEYVHTRILALIEYLSTVQVE